MKNPPDGGMIIAFGEWLSASPNGYLPAAKWLSAFGRMKENFLAELRGNFLFLLKLSLDNVFRRSHTQIFAPA
jgi:hypothetical protein